ncbi:MAG TPA: UDP-N-acetylmuramoyl-L-alanine--D-glutamate ligase [Acidimicrobiia bacterium]|nr:UDP-N-acetylmuramoyl-L-alanine--D-glutamate ligase [Acidimicrobiia bacterium]
MTAALVIGLAATGEAVARRLRAEGVDVVVTDDQPGGAAYDARSIAVRDAGATLVESPSPADYDALVADTDLVVPSPLVAESHPAVQAARRRDVPVRSEIDLAGERARVPIVAVTGTNGKTTVTTLTAAMLSASGVRAAAAGNIGRTLLDAVDDDVDVLVAEVSSFQLAFAETFAPAVAILLAIADDHLDWHGSFDHYVWSKSRIFEHQRGKDLLVYDADDDIASRAAVHAPAGRVGVTRAARAATYHVSRGELRTPEGRALIAIKEMPRALTHDVTNALAAAAAALDVGATPDGVHDTLASFATLPHRVTLVGEHRGVRYYDDSKATNPHAALSALASFESVVLIAGGRNKGLDLGVLATAADRIRAVVAIGEAAPEVIAAFDGVRPVTTAPTMRDAVRTAAAASEPGDAVLLSPACASFDAYSGYAARGDDFAAEVRALIEDEGVVAR